MWVGAVTPGTTVDRAYQYTTTRELAAIWDSAAGIARFELRRAGRLLAVVPEHARGELFSYDVNGNVSEGGDPYAREYGAGGRLRPQGRHGVLLERRRAARRAPRAAARRRADNPLRMVGDGSAPLRGARRRHPRRTSPTIRGRAGCRSGCR